MLLNAKGRSDDNKRIPPPEVWGGKQNGMDAITLIHTRRSERWTSRKRLGKLLKRLLRKFVTIIVSIQKSIGKSAKG